MLWKGFSVIDHQLSYDCRVIYQEAIKSIHLGATIANVVAGYIEPL
jgi:hypothetical protein